MDDEARLFLFKPDENATWKLIGKLSFEVNKRNAVKPEMKEILQL
jgi:hypothetical protein